MTAWLAPLTRRGFVGPRYSGVLGRIRLVAQRLFLRTDVILVAEPEDRRSRANQPSEFTLRWIGTWEAFAPYAAGLDAAYFPGFARAWREVFGWGEVLALALIGDAVAGFGWVQTGRAEGMRCGYGVLFDGDYRVLRVGVLPSMRGRGVNTWFYGQVLDDLFARGARRVYIDCAKDNIPSLKAQLRAGFRPVAELSIGGWLLGNRMIGPLRSPRLDVNSVR